jgi:hypothetical protein
MDFLIFTLEHLVRWRSRCTWAHFATRILSLARSVIIIQGIRSVIQFLGSTETNKQGNAQSKTNAATLIRKETIEIVGYGDEEMKSK